MSSLTRRDEQMIDEQPPIQIDDARLEQTTWHVIGLRYALPGAVLLAGLVVMALGSEADLEGGAGIVGAGLAIYAMNWLYRASVDGDRVRDEEEAARAYFDVHGRWPDESSGALRGRDSQVQPGHTAVDSKASAP
jgi:hypothetical protein